MSVDRGSRALEVIRDPLWDNITLDETALSLVDSAPFQRLRYVRQLGHAFLVYPGATHGRFEHGLGAYHLTRRALAALEVRGELVGISDEDRMAVTLAALLHDVGHYPFSHALEEAGFPSHEAQGEARLTSGVLHERLVAIGGSRFPGRVADLIRTRSRSPLQGLISGTLDLDKIDYLCRDSRMCGVPYGTVDVDRLLGAITMVPAGPLGGRTLGVQEKGVSALESLLFSKYQMYRNVYWHHAVRSATCMFKRAARGAVRRGIVTLEQVARLTDDELMQILIEKDRNPLATALRERRLYKRALDLPGSEVHAATPEWVAEDPDLLEQVEDALAVELGLAPGELLLDFPSRHSMLGVDLPLRLRDGSVERLTDEGRAGHLGLPRIAGELYQSARRLRVFVARPVADPLDRVVGLIARPAMDIAAGLAEKRRLLKQS
ncbi:MAG TPA: HD domain-containing protein [Gemmatimonadales bacterium]|nr:HD domain-containing protein [Gemmatimonadales bacterium]